MSANHTPGPWHFNNDPTPQHIYSADNTLIAIVAIGCDRKNAPIIAAAPDLYEALKYSQYVIEAMYQRTKNKSALEYMRRNVAALAKAEGI